MDVNTGKDSHVLYRQYLCHISVYFVARPAWNVPSVVVVFAASNAKSAIYAARSSEEFPSTQCDLSTIQRWVRLVRNKPVIFRPHYFADSGEMLVVYFESNRDNVLQTLLVLRRKGQILLIRLLQELIRG